MITFALEHDDPTLKTLVDLAGDQLVIVTRDGRPAFAFIPVDAADVQTWQLGENPQFLALMQRSWDRMQAEGSVSLAEARRILLGD